MADENVIPVEALAGKSVFIGTPCYGEVPAYYCQSAFETINYLNGYKVPYSWSIIQGCCYVTHARNVLVAQFLGTECTHLMFIDADIRWRGPDIIRLLAREKPLIVGPYPKRSFPITYTFNQMVDAKGEVINDNGAIEVKEAGTGFMLIERSVLEDMIKHYGNHHAGTITQYGTHYREANELLKGKAQDMLYNLFPTQIDTEAWVSEDFVFCRHYKQMGGRIWMDPAVELGHIGTHIYSSKMSDIVTVKETPKEA